MFSLTPAGLALLIAHGNKTSQPSGSGPCTQQTQLTPTDHPDVRFVQVKDTDASDMDFDMSEAEPEVQI